jgi:ABC-2 type transport system ATP-binding protein
MSDFVPLLSMENVTKRYGEYVALSDVSLRLQRGRIIGLLGPNGSGKTTLIKLIAGLLTADAGEIFVEGEKIGVRSKSLVSYLPERNSLPLSMTVEELIAYFKDFFADFDTDRCRKMLEDLQVPLDLPIRRFSKGTREKLQLIMVMSRHARLYILDEPIAGVDPAARDYILDVVFKNRDEGSTVLISTHLIRDVESTLGDFIFLQNGVVVRYDSVESVHKEGTTVDALFREVFRW